MFLERIGAGEALYGAFSPYSQQQLILARVAIAQHDRYYIYTENGPAEAELSGALYYRACGRSSLPVTGDWVAARMAGAGAAIIDAVLPRHTCLSRRAAGARNEEQPLAANVDIAFLVCGLDGDFNLRRLERYLALVAASGASPVVVLNKADLCAGLKSRIAEAASVARNAPVLPVSALDPHGLESLRRIITPGATVALLGSSGVGKSTIANRLLGEDHFRTAEVRMRDSRGRHTTVRRELVPLPDSGALIDTPGMRELQLWLSPENIEDVFDDVTAIAQGCRFRDCTHSGEPACAISEALLAGRLDSGRWESFRKLRAEAEWHEATADPFAALERKRKWKNIHKQARAFANSKRHERW